MLLTQNKVLQLCKNFSYKEEGLKAVSKYKNPFPNLL